MDAPRQGPGGSPQLPPGDALVAQQRGVSNIVGGQGRLRYAYRCCDSHWRWSVEAFGRGGCAVPRVGGGEHLAL
eukprot:5420875-Pyramimonas_sp.AAC.1